MAFSNAMRLRDLEQDELLTVDEVAQILKVPRSWVYEKTRRGTLDRLPHIKLGKYLRFYRKDVLNFMEGLRRGASLGRETRVEIDGPNG